MSATTGDRYPARAFFQILIALTAGPRFILVGLWYFCTVFMRSSSPGFAKCLLIVGLVRTVSCGGWVYITSTDDHMTHDIAMVIYVLCTLPWQLGVIYTTSSANIQAVKRRRWLTCAFFGTLPPMIYFFLEHKVHQIPGGNIRWHLYDSMHLY